MAKFKGKIGYVSPIETAPGVWEDDPAEKNYRGDVILNQERWQPSDGANKNLNIDNSISIVADQYAYSHYGNIKYVIWNDQKWEVQSIAVNRPRIVLQIGGLYNGGK
mgnify:FL=1